MGFKRNLLLSSYALGHRTLYFQVSKLSKSRAKLFPRIKMCGFDRLAAPRSCDGPVEATECQGARFMQGWLYIMI